MEFTYRILEFLRNQDYELIVEFYGMTEVVIKLESGVQLRRGMGDNYEEWTITREKQNSYNTYTETKQLGTYEMSGDEAYDHMEEILTIILELA